MKNLYLIRGVSGSGKTTLANELFEVMANSGYSADEVCADDFFTDENGEYMFDAALLPRAHQWCRNYTEHAMKVGVSAIFVHNTFTTEKEMEPYFNLAKTHGYQVVTLVVENRHGSESVHSVPKEVVDRQRARLKNNLSL